MSRWIGLITTLILAGGSATLSAQPANPAAGDTPPLMAGRVAAVEGEVNIWRAEEAGGGQWDRAQINDIVTAGTGLATDNGRVEVRFGPHTVRLGEASTGGFSQLDYEARAFNLERGVVSVRLAPAQQAETVTLTVADVRVDLAAPGRYRVDAIGDAPLAISVFDGRATVQYGGNAVNVGVGQALNMTQSSTNYAVARMSALDDWALSRDARYEQAQAPSYVSPYMTGYEELNTYGDWVMEPAFGNVWVPRAVPIGWAPYRYGRWRWVAPWGWSWVDSAPWGYAPFHYGRWVTIGGRWCWWPGGYAARPVWAPALVGFVGGGGTSVSVGFGGPVVGWYPLAPWHPYRPYYRANNTYVTVINQTIIQRPPNGVPPDINQRPGSTWVAGPRFREPIAKVHIPARTETVAELRPAPPPPRPITRTPAVVAETGAAPGGRVAPARPAPAVAQNSKFSAAPPQPLPGAATPTLSQPAPTNRIQPRPQPAPAQLPEHEAPRAQPRVPQANANLPPYQQPQKPVTAEPARTTPPVTSPTIQQPVPGSAPRVVTAPPVFTSPPGYANPPVNASPPARANSPAHASPKAPPPAPVQAQGAAPPTASATPPPGVHGNPHAPATAPNARAQPAPQAAQPGAVRETQQQKSDDARADQRGNKPPVDVPRAKTVAQ